MGLQGRILRRQPSKKSSSRRLARALETGADDLELFEIPDLPELPLYNTTFEQLTTPLSEGAQRPSGAGRLDPVSSTRGVINRSGSRARSRTDPTLRPPVGQYSLTPSPSRIGVLARAESPRVATAHLKSILAFTNSPRSAIPEA